MLDLKTTSVMWKLRPATRAWSRGWRRASREPTHATFISREGCLVGAQMAWRLVRQVLVLMTVAAVATLAIAPAVASPGGEAAPESVAPVHRLALVAEETAGHDSTFTASFESSTGGDSWTPAAGEQMTFAYVTDGAGYVTGINGGPVGSMTCVTDQAGQCTITVRTEAPGDSVVTAVTGSLSASAVVR